MILNIIRIFFLIILLILLVIDIKYSIFFKNSVNQFIIACLILFILIILDAPTGFIIGLIFLTIYYKNNTKKIEKIIKNKEEKFINLKTENKKIDKDNKDLYNELLPYISPELLINAQNNIYDNDNYKSEIKGFNDENKKIYGAQGLDIEKNDYKGFDLTDIYSTL